ncbi:MAG: hypothetical protein ACOYJA_07980 [Christensenellales bacterium]|jgi:hypothetical protein
MKPLLIALGVVYTLLLGAWLAGRFDRFTGSGCLRPGWGPGASRPPRAWPRRRHPPAA